jgi:hypothetical protein
VKCESRSTLATALFDYGQNKNNVSSILYGISQYFGNLSTLQVSEDVF